MPLLNGADIYERIRKHLRKGYVLPSCLYLGTHIESPGVIFQKGGSCQISIGKDPSYPGFYPEKLIDLFKSADILIEFFEDINIEMLLIPKLFSGYCEIIWKKYRFIFLRLA